MSTSTSFVELPENLEFAVGLSRNELGDQVKLMAALKMFELGKISSGKAAELAGMSRVDFFAACGRYRVSIFNYPPDTLAQAAYGSREQLFVRIASETPFEQLWREPGFLEVMGSVAFLGLWDAAAR